MAAARAKQGKSHDGPTAAVNDFDAIESVPRLLLIAVLKRRAQRSRRYCSLPLAYLFLGLFITAMMTRAGVTSDAYAFDKNVVLLTGADSSYFDTQFPTAAAWLGAVLGVTSAWDATCAPPANASAPFAYDSTWQSATVDFVPAPGVNSVAFSVLYSAFSSLDAQGWAPAFDSDAGTSQPDLSAQGRLPGRGFVLGGAALTQRRFAPGPCPLASNFSQLGGGTGGSACATTGGPSTAPFGLARTTGTGVATTVAAFDGAELPLGRAFAPAGVPGAPRAEPAFRAWLSAYAPVPTTLCREGGFLLDAGWLDDATAALELSFAALNAELGRVAHVRLTASASGGGLWTHAWRVQSVALSPYGAFVYGAAAPPAPGLAVVLDILVCAYFCYLVLSVCKRGARGCILAAGDAHRAQGGHGACLNVCLCAGALPARLPPLAVAVDWFAVAATAAAIGTWASHCADLGALNGALAALPRVTPTLVDGGADPAVWAPGPGTAPAVPGGPPPWATVEALAGAAVDSFVAFQLAALLALIGLTVRTLKYMAFQAHLAVLFNTLRSSCSSMAHFSLPLVTAMVMFGVWGMFSFGHHLHPWSTSRGAALSIMRFLMYDYDIAGMTYADGTNLSALFYTAFMMGMTNIMLWLFFASLFDSYSIEKSRLAQWPTFAAETSAFLASLPFMLPACVSALLPRRGAPCCSGRHRDALLRGICVCPNRRGAPPLARTVATWDELISACARGPLRHQAAVTPECLTRALGFAPEAAALLVADVAAAAAAATALAESGGAMPAGAEERLSAAAGYYGMGLPQGPRLSEAALAKLRRAYPVLARAIEEGEIERARVAGAFVDNARTGGGAAAAEAAAALEGEEEDAFDKANPPVLRTLGRAAARACCGGGGGGGGGGSDRVHVVGNPLAAGAPPAPEITPLPTAVGGASPFAAFDIHGAPPLSDYSASEFGGGGGAELAAARAEAAAAEARARGDVVSQEEHVVALFQSHASQRFPT